MATSTKLVTDAYVLPYAPPIYCRNANNTPSTSSKYHFTSAQGKLLKAYSSGNAGVIAHQRASRGTLRDVYGARQENPLLSLGMHNPVITMLKEEVDYFGDIVGLSVNGKVQNLGRNNTFLTMKGHLQTVEPLLNQSFLN